jgi:hypothetical protein
MSKATNSEEFAAAMARTQARKDAEDALPPEAKAFLNALQHRWFPVGKTEDYDLVKRTLIDAWSKS